MIRMGIIKIVKRVGGGELKAMQALLGKTH